MQQTMTWNIALPKRYVIENVVISWRVITRHLRPDREVKVVTRNRDIAGITLKTWKTLQAEVNAAMLSSRTARVSW